MEEIKRRVVRELNEVSVKIDEHAQSDSDRKLAQDFKDIVTGTNPDREFSADEITNIFNSVLQGMGATEVGWKAIKTDEEIKTTANTNQDKKQVEVPKNKKEKTISLRGLIVHELLTHVKRGVQGEKSGLLLLSAGLNDYEPFEEGLATARETAIKGDKMKNFGSINHYLSIALKRGVDGKKRTFVEVAEIMKDYFTLQEAANKGEKKDPEDLALATVIRTHRGIKNTGEADCAAFTKDLGYLKGRAKGLPFLDKNRDVFNIIDYGKFNYTDVKQLGHVKTLAAQKIAA